jgi:TM2 domain-containing membrane protein YozV
MTCSNCQRALKDDAAFCNHCGQVVPRETAVEGEAAVPVADQALEVSQDSTAVDEPEAEDAGDELELDDQDEDAPEEVEEPAAAPSNTQAKSFRTVWLIAVFGGWLGIDRFYLGHIGTGVLKLLGGGWYGIWWSVDMIRLLRGRQADKNGVLVEDHDNFRPVAVVISTVLFTLIGLCWLIVILAALTPSSSD